MHGPTLEELGRVFKTLSNVNRLRLLVALQSPKGHHELYLPPTRRGDEGERPITRQALSNHLRSLMALGVVKEAPRPNGGGTKYVVDHAALFSVVEQMRQLATVRSTIELPGQTFDLEQRAAGMDLQGPHLVLARGVYEGRAFPLSAIGGDAEWAVGRKRSADVCLDYDPYVSSEHARLLRKGGRFFLGDLPSNKNGTYLNWGRLVRGGVAPLRAGDLVGVGMSLLVFRE